MQKQKKEAHFTVKISETVKKETLYIAVWVVLMSFLMQAVFLVTKNWDITVLFGNILSGSVSVLNFFLMGLTVQKAVEKDEKGARTAMKASQSLRTVMVFALTAVGVLLPCFDTWASLIPLFFPRIAIMFRPFFDKQKSGGALNEK